MSVSRTYDQPYYWGTVATVARSTVTPWDVVINGQGYLLDLVHPQAPPYGMKSVPMLKAMFLQDRGTVPIGEHSLNPDDYWRRSVDDWSAGAGQENLDHHDSVSNRFRESKGIDCWTSGSISLLNDTTLSLEDVELAVVAGNRLYITAPLAGNTVLLVTADIGLGFGVVSAATSTIGTLVAITSDGYTVWVADQTRVYSTTRGAGTYAPFHAADHACDVLRSAKSRLFSAKGPTLYTHTLTPGSAVASRYFTQPNPDWTWTDIAGGPDSVYFSGFSGDKSQIYAATIKSDGSALDAPAVVATLPDGEIVRAMREYLGTLIIGTDLGFRVAVIGGNAGALTLGQLVAMDHPPTCFEAQDRFVWFGWTNYDATSTGLGRMDLSTFNGISPNALGTPAYASDLMATAAGAVTSVVTFGGKRVFTVAGSGIWVETSDHVTSGTIASGWLNYELADPKIAIKISAQHRKGRGTFSAAVAADDRDPVNVGVPITTSSSSGSSARIALPQIVARNYEVLFTLTPDALALDESPSLDRWTLMVEPQPERRFTMTVPLRLHSAEMNKLGATVTFSPSAEVLRFRTLCESREVVSFQDFETAYQAIIDDIEWIPYAQVGNARTWDGCLVLSTKIIN